MELIIMGFSEHVHTILNWNELERGGAHGYKPGKWTNYWVGEEGRKPWKWGVGGGGGGGDSSAGRASYSKARRNTDTGSSPRSDKGFFSQS